MRAWIVWLAAGMIFFGTVCFINKKKEPSVRTAVSEAIASEQEKLKLYAQSAVLMDADSGRILYEKNGEEPLAMASTTKIMTLIVALELEEEGEIAVVSEYAQAQPKVRLGMKQGETFYLDDLYYSLMLESHNDTAVCIAETIGSRMLGMKELSKKPEESQRAVQAFLDKMNEKAQKIGLEHTYFATPNGLDAQMTKEDGTVWEHQTTASELALIMRYCIRESCMREKFLKITGTLNWSFQDVNKTRSFSCTNHNAFLQMMDGALTGKTGYTSKAGYCYVGALQKEDRTFIVALLACGWPNHKGYKWEDTRKLMEYGLEHYQYKEVFQKDMTFTPIRVSEGIPENGKWRSGAYVPVGLDMPEEEQTLRLLMHNKEQVKIFYRGKEVLTAPVQKGETVGSVFYALDGAVAATYPVKALNTVKKIDFEWCFRSAVWKFIPDFLR